MAKKKSARKAAKTKKATPKKKAPGAARRRGDGTMTFHYGGDA
jgi:hypothetical protein